jgi:DNA polymerase-3 subunit alpha
LSGQRSFFREDEVAPSEEAPQATTEEFSKGEILNFEKELLGLYVSGHPLEDVEDRLSLFRSCTLASLEGAEDGRELFLSGRVESVKTIQTQGGKRMAFVTLEDLSGQVEVIVFPQQYERFRPLLKRDCLLFVRGRLESRGARQGIIAEEVIPFEELDERSELHLLLESDSVNEAKLASLREVLIKHPGPSRVYLHVVDGEARETIAAGSDFRVRLSRSLVEELERLLGQERVAVQTSRSQQISTSQKRRDAVGLRG